VVDLDRERHVGKRFRSKPGAALYSDSLRRPAGAAAPNTAMPAESGPRSVMPISIGSINSPSRSRSAGFFTSNPTIPHIVFAPRFRVGEDDAACGGCDSAARL
jgi:hypothetical protein